MKLDELTESTLAEVCSLVTDGTHDTPKRVTSGYPLIKAKEIVGGRIDFETCDQISEVEHRKVIARSKPEFGDTLFAHIGASLGEAAFVNTNHEFSIKNVALFKPNPAVIAPRYLYYLVISPTFQDSAKGTKTGSAQPFLGLSQLRGHAISYHRDLSTQRRIAGILSAYDELIENNQRRIRILEDMARSLYREWFVHFRYPGHESVPLTDSRLGQTPQDWEVKELAELCQRMESGGTPKRAESTFWNDGEIDWFKTRELWDGFLFGSEERITSLGLKKSSARLFEPGTILMAIYGSPTVGRLGILTRPSSCNQAALGMVADGKKISQTFLYFVLLFLRAHFNGLAQGAAQQNISKEKVAGTHALVPPCALVSAFDRVAEPIFSQIRVLQEQTANLRGTRDLLLPRLLSGQVNLVET